MRTTLGLLLIAASCGAPPEAGSAPEPEVGFAAAGRDREGTARGFPTMRDLAGRRLADGEFTQRLEGDRVHVRIRYDFGGGRTVEETSVLRQEPELVQERWGWVETRSGTVHRRFEIDFLARKASAAELRGETLRRWEEPVDIEPGRAFAGSAWALAIRRLRERLLQGETIPMRTVGFTPGPRAATLEISYEGLDVVPMAGRSPLGERYKLHPVVPWIAKAFVDVPDSRIWLTSPPPTAFLRFEGPLAEPSDPIVRVDLLPGEPSERATKAEL